MSGPENNPPFRDRNPDKDITFDANGIKHTIPDGTFIPTGKEFLPLCKMCIKSPMTCENGSAREIWVPMEPGDDPKLEVWGASRLPSGEMPEMKGLGLKVIDGVKVGFYKKASDLRTVIICESFTRKPLG